MVAALTTARCGPARPCASPPNARKLAKGEGFQEMLTRAKKDVDFRAFFSKISTAASDSGASVAEVAEVAEGRP
jgi:hypothetical protein